jgi:hypothetical protein
MSRRLLPRPWCRLLLACAVLAALPPLGRGKDADAPTAPRHFAIPAGEALSTLSLFARQSSLPLVYLVADVRDEKTQAIKGSFDPMKALESMLAGSNLAVSYDHEAKALMVTRRKTAAPAPVLEPDHR